MFRIPTVTKNLLIINILCFLAMIALGQLGIADLNNICGLHFFLASDFHLYQLVTYMFMHGGWEHIILNMFMLWMFGAVMERVWGPKRFIIYYLFCGIGAGLMQEIAQFVQFYIIASEAGVGFSSLMQVAAANDAALGQWTTVGASGAIYALLLAFGMMFPDEKMFIIPIPIPIKAKWMVIGSIAVELFSALASPGSQVAHLAHLGGMIFGFFLIRYWQKHPYDNSFDGGRQFFNNLRNRWDANRVKHGERTSWDEELGGFRSGKSHQSPSSEATQEEIDRILDKIRKSGYDSLTREEKQTLFDQSKK